MLTKENYAKYIITKFISDNKLDMAITDFKELNKYALQSSDLCIALNALGMLDSEYKEYANGRSGSVVVNAWFYYIDKKYVEPSDYNSDQWTKFCTENQLTVRDIMDILPE